jgi:hypothetical protein
MPTEQIILFENKGCFVCPFPVAISCMNISLNDMEISDVEG